jgi:hypothetical protein
VVFCGVVVVVVSGAPDEGVVVVGSWACGVGGCNR